jgi:small-conductance mechanosensitive channel/CRP-like cAMP-binding protein
MEFLFKLFDECSHGLSFVLLLSFAVVSALVRFADPAEKAGLKKFYVVIPLQLLLVGLAAAFGEGAGRLYRDFRLAAMALSGTGLVLLADTLAFGVLLNQRKAQVPMIIRHVIIAASSFLYLLFLCSYFALNFTGLVATSAVLTMVIGLSLQDTLGSVIGGMALQFDKAIAVGDWIKLGDVSGQVVEITWRSTAVETARWHTVIIPNSSILRGQVAVIGRRKGKPYYERREINFNVGLDTPPADVIRVMNEGIQKDTFKDVATTPKPSCIITDLSKDVGNYTIRYWLTDLDMDMPTDSMMRTKLYFILKRAGISLAVPARAITMTQLSKEAVEERSSAERQRRLDALSDLRLFDGLSGPERQRLAGSLSNAPFAKGENLTKQGTEAHWLYIIVQGEVSVRVEKDGAEAEVARLGVGDFFGEMSLMTGEKRAATVVALSEVDCLRLDKEAFQELVQARPALAEDVAEIIAARKAALLASSQGLDDEARRRHHEESKQDLLGQIQRFFSLD